eukprot:4545444-Alexandrium_andersonii.AAC.1
MLSLWRGPKSGLLAPPTPTHSPPREGRGRLLPRLSDRKRPGQSMTTASVESGFPRLPAFIGQRL